MEEEFSLVPRNKEIRSEIFRALDRDDIEEPYSSKADWNKVIYNYSTNHKYTTYAQILQFRPRKWYLEYLEVIFKLA
jgi:hypothetical protein